MAETEQGQLPPPQAPVHDPRQWPPWYRWFLFVDSAIRTLVSGAAGSHTVYDIAAYYDSTIEASSLFTKVAVARPFQLPSALAGSVAKAGQPAGARAAFPILKNTTNIGWMVFEAGETDGTFSFPTTVDFDTPDVLQVVCPRASDVSLRDISVTFKGVLT